jgi:hypothetical protein
VVASSIATRPRPARSCQPDQRSPC